MKCWIKQNVCYLRLWLKKFNNVPSVKCGEVNAHMLMIKMEELQETVDNMKSQLYDVIND